MTRIKTLFLITTLLVSMSVAAETKKYTGTIYVNANKSLMPLANGDAVVLVEANGIASLSGNPPAILSVKCAGMGTVDPNSEASTEFYCSLLESEEDGLDIKGAVNEKLGNFEVIGGSGKWLNAKGKGQFTQVIQTAEGSKNVFEMKVTTP